MTDGIQVWTTDQSRRQDLSLLLPVQNVQDRLQTCLDEAGSSLAAYPGRVEILVLDRGSSDGTGGLLARQGMTEVGNRTLRRIHLEENATEGGALRVGLSRARGESFAVLGGNLGAPPSCLPPLLAALDRGAELALVRVGPMLAATFACRGDAGRAVAAAATGPDHPLSALLKLPLQTGTIPWPASPTGEPSGGFEGFIPFAPLAWFDRWRRISLPRVLHDTGAATE